MCGPLSSNPQFRCRYDNPHILTLNISFIYIASIYYIFRLVKAKKEARFIQLASFSILGMADLGCRSAKLFDYSRIPLLRPLPY
jgi:hypothetical protein